MKKVRKNMTVTASKLLDTVQSLTDIKCGSIFIYEIQNVPTRQYGITYELPVGDEELIEEEAS